MKAHEGNESKGSLSWAMPEEQAVAFKFGVLNHQKGILWWTHLI